jgi:lipopolysaccharide/colanic/teichoic acid biosynthesis glycosyltransferase
MMRGLLSSLLLEEGQVSLTDNSEHFSLGSTDSLRPIKFVPADGVPASGPKQGKVLEAQGSRPLQELCKRTIDLVVSFIGLSILTPVFIHIAFLILLDSKGPVFFKQRRVGKDGRHFLIWKFRTMTALDDGDIIVQAQRCDPRVTRVGRYLRKLNIDELPQLVNVLRGEMSLVGPRPHAVAHDIEFAKRQRFYSQRTTVKPGITGWAQVNGFRGEIATEDALGKRVEHDIYYVKHRSLWFDAYILLLTTLPRAFRNAR